MISTFGDMFKRVFCISKLHKYLFPLLIFLDLNPYSKWDLFLIIDVIKALSIYIVIASSFIENSLCHCFENSTFIKY